MLYRERETENRNEICSQFVRSSERNTECVAYFLTFLTGRFIAIVPPSICPLLAYFSLLWHSMCTGQCPISRCEQPGRTSTFNRLFTSFRTVRISPSAIGSHSFHGYFYFGIVRKRTYRVLDLLKKIEKLRKERITKIKSMNGLKTMANYRHTQSGDAWQANLRWHCAYSK